MVREEPVVSAIAFRDVWKECGDQIVLEDVSPEIAVFPHLSVLDNVMLGADFVGGGLFARLCGGKRRAARAEAGAAARRGRAVGLRGALSRLPFWRCSSVSRWRKRS